MSRSRSRSRQASRPEQQPILNNPPVTRGVSKWGRSNDGRTDLDYEASLIPSEGTGADLTDRQRLLLLRLPLVQARRCATSVYTNRGELTSTYGYLTKMSDAFLASIGSTSTLIPRLCSERPHNRARVQANCQLQWNTRYPTGSDFP